MWVMSFSRFVSVLVSFSRTFSLLPEFLVFSSWFCYLWSHIQLPRPSGFILVIRHSTSTMDFRVFGCALYLRPYGSIRLLLPSGSTSVLTHFTSVLQHPASTSAAHHSIRLSQDLHWSCHHLGQTGSVLYNVSCLKLVTIIVGYHYLGWLLWVSSFVCSTLVVSCSICSTPVVSSAGSPNTPFNKVFHYFLN